jgi:hypothetical protein
VSHRLGSAPVLFQLFLMKLCPSEDESSAPLTGAAHLPAATRRD